MPVWCAEKPYGIDVMALLRAVAVVQFVLELPGEFAGSYAGGIGVCRV
jgi:hypothetical protein